MSEDKNKKSADFPVLLYKCPGQHNGGKIAGKLRTYSDASANSPEEMNELLKDGWSKSLPEAAKLEDAPKAAAK